MLMAALLLVSHLACAGDKPASCELANKSTLSRFPSGLAQVSNLGTIEITCRVPARPFPTKPGESHNCLGVTTTAYKISPANKKELVSSEVKLSGGGIQRDPEVEWVNFYVHIPLEDAERDEEGLKYIAKIFKSMTPEQLKQLPEGASERGLERIREFVYQNRFAHFQVECRILDVIE
jgi:hypothetical protein